MTRNILLLLLIGSILGSCRSTRKLQTVIAGKDSLAVKESMAIHEDTLRFIGNTLTGIRANQIDYTSFSAKIDVDYMDVEERKYNVTAHVRMIRDSVIWISVRAILGIEGLRALITKDSVKLLDKQNNIYTARSVSFLQEVTALPLELRSLQDLLVGNPVFLDSNIVSYTESDDAITLISVGTFFKNLFTVGKEHHYLRSSKLDDLDELRNRTCFLAYSDYENKKGMPFSTKRQITVTEKKKLDIKLDFKQYEYNETLSFPFNLPKNYKTN